MASLQVVGTGLWRTGTYSLKLALDRLLGTPCYRGADFFNDPEHIRVWRAALDGDLPDWNDLFAGYQATIGWPAAAFWTELIDAYPDAIVLLSVRPTAEWWYSARHTIIELLRSQRSLHRSQRSERLIQEEPPRHPDITTQGWMLAEAVIWARFCQNLDDEGAVCEAYERYNEAVRQRVPAGCLVEWTPGDGWGPICTALGLPVPKDPFPHTNTTEEFRATMKLPPLL